MSRRMRISVRQSLGSFSVCKVAALCSPGRRREFGCFMLAGLILVARSLGCMKNSSPGTNAFSSPWRISELHSLLGCSHTEQSRFLQV